MVAMKSVCFFAPVVSGRLPAVLFVWVKGLVLCKSSDFFSPMEKPITSALVFLLFGPGRKH